MDILDAPLNELVALAVALALALGLLSLLLWARGLSAGMPRSRVRRALLSLWLIIVGLMALLVAVRGVLGTPLIGGSYAEGQVWLADITGPQWILLGLVAAVVLAAAVWLRRLLRPFMLAPAPPTEPTPSEDSC